RPDRRLRDRRHRRQHPLRGGPLVPRARRAAADPELGPDAVGRRLERAVPRTAVARPDPRTHARVVDAVVPAPRRRTSRRARDEVGDMIRYATRRLVAALVQLLIVSFVAYAIFFLIADLTGA